MQTKILHTITSGAYGGLEIYVTQLIKEHSKNLNYDIHVLLTENSLIHNELKSANVKFHFLNSRKKLDWNDVFKLVSIVKKYSIDIVHCHTNRDLPRTSVAKLFICFKYVFSSYMNPIKGKKNLMHRFIYSRIDLFITTSLVTNNFVKEHYPIVSDKVNQLHYGRFLEQYIHSQTDRDAFRKQIGADESTIVFGTMCRIDRQKGVKELAESILFLPEQLKPNIKILIIGDPTITNTDANGKVNYEHDAIDTQNWIKDFINKNKVDKNIILMPFQKEFIKWLDAIDVFVLASYQEMYSLAVIDAMLMGKPVIGTNAGGTIEQVKDRERGLLIEPHSAEEIAKGIEFYLNNSELIKQHGNNAHIWALNSHSMDKMLERLDGFYKLALA